jgi:hypothetical protein
LQNNIRYVVVKKFYYSCVIISFYNNKKIVLSYAILQKSTRKREGKGFSFPIFLLDFYKLDVIKKYIYRSLTERRKIIRGGDI